MNDSPEKMAARQKIADAILAFATTDTEMDDDQFLGDWAIVAHMPKLTDPGYAEYLVIFPSMFVPSHVAQGLFSTGIDVASGDGWNRKDDDDD